MSKQDRQGARTISEFERRHNYGERFNEVMGVASEARRMAEEAQDDLDGLTQEQIFNILTNNGNAQGLFRTEDGQVYINASYIAGGVLQSADGKVKIFLNGGAPVFNTGVSTNGVMIRGDAAGGQEVFDISAKNVDGRYVANLLMKNTYGQTIAQLTEDVSRTGGGLLLEEATGSLSAIAQASLGSAGFRLLRDGETIAYLGADTTSSGMRVDSVSTASVVTDWITANSLNGKTLSWKDNGDGTYTLIGT